MSLPQMPMSFATIQHTLEQWMTQQSGLQARWADQPAAPKPSLGDIDGEGFSQLKINLGQTIGRDYTTRTFGATNSQGKEMQYVTRGLRQLTISCQTFCRGNKIGANAWACGEAARTSLSFPPVKRKFKQAALAFISSTDLQNLDGTDDVWHSRASFDLVVRAPAAVMADIGGYITSVHFDITAKTDNGDVHMTA